MKHPKLSLISTLVCLGFLALTACSSDDSSSSSASSGEGGQNNDKPNTESTLTQMACSEIMYHHPDSTVEWVEIFIEEGEDIENMALSELRLDGAVEYNFPEEALKKGEHIVVTGDLDAFKKAYPDFNGRLFGPWNTDNKGYVEKLSNGGDVVSVKLRGAGDVDCSFDNTPPWPSLADGEGASLVYLGGNASMPTNWAASKKLGGNPGSGEDEVYAPLTVRINEVAPTDGSNDWIEFYNSGKADADISGWLLIAKRRADTLTIPAGTVVPANGFLVLEQSVFGESLLLLRRGENLYLREFIDGKWTNSETGLEYPATPSGTAGVLELSDGTLMQGSLKSETKGKKNVSEMLSGPLYVNEIFYNPPEGQIEFIEIINTADSAVALSLPVGSKSGVWEISGLGEAALETIKIPAGGLLLMLPDTSILDLDAYASTLAENVVLQKYSGKISNRGEQILVKEPYAFVEDLTKPNGIDWCYRWSDAVLYSDDGLWSEEADGMGMSLHRADFSMPGSDPAAWEANLPTPGEK